MIEKRLVTSSGSIHYWISEKGDDPETALVFLPGLTADHRLFDKQVAAFEGKVRSGRFGTLPLHGASLAFQFNFSLMDKAK